MGERRTTFVLLTIFVALLATRAEAALWMEFEPRHAYPGSSVEGRTMGNGALSPDSGPLPAYLRAVASNDLIPIGNVRVDARGNGRLSFTVPEISGGWYSVVMSCPSCSVYSTHGDEVKVGNLRVLGPKREVAENDGAEGVENEGAVRDAPGPPLDAVVVAAACALLLAVGALYRRGRASAVTKAR
jgi:hypothetical protein